MKCLKRMRVLALVVSAGLTACAQPGPVQAPRVDLPPEPTVEDDGPRIQDDIRIAAVLPLTGPQARLGDAMVKGIELAFFEARDPRLKLRIFDSAGSEATAETRAQLTQRVMDFAPAAVIGPLFSENAQALAPAMLAQTVPVLSFSNDVAANAAGAILLGQQPEQEVARVLAHVADRLETRRLGMIVPDDEYGARVTVSAQATVDALNAPTQEDYEAEQAARLEAAHDRLLSLGASIFEPPKPQAPVFEVTQEGVEAEEDTLEPLRLFTITENRTFPRNLRELDTPVREVAQFYRRKDEVEQERQWLRDFGHPMGLDYLDSIRNLDTFAQPRYDALIVADGGQLLRALAPLLNVYAIDEEETLLLGTGLWNDPGLAREPALHGGLFAAAQPVDSDRFGQSFESAYGAPPPPLAAMAYDAMAIVALAARDGADQPALFDPARLFAEGGYVGASGLMRITPSGIAERALAIMRVTESGLVIEQPAPQRFDPYPEPKPVPGPEADPIDPISR